MELNINKANFYFIINSNWRLADFLTLLFESVSAFGTVGLSMGITPQLSSWGKIAIMFTMFCGRLGPLTLAFALSQNKDKMVQIKYPDERIIIG